MRRAGLISGVILAIGAGATDARADRRPTVATDAFFIGARVDPGWALVGAWDLDVYLRRDRIASVGPAVSLAILGSGVPDGRQQDLLLAVDFLRLKIGPPVTGGEWRPFVTLGGGFVYARLPEQIATNVEITPAGGGTTVRGDRRYAAVEEFAPVITVGAGTDYFPNGPLGLTLQMLTRFHPTGDSRIPDAWFEIQLGVRFGL